MKTCKTCGASKLLDAFYKSKSCSQGVTTNCKSCTNEENRKWDLANPDKRRAYVRKSQKKHYPKRKESIVAANKARRNSDPQKAREIQNAWNHKNISKVRKIRQRAGKLWAEKNPEKISAYNEARKIKLRLLTEEKNVGSWLHEEET